MKTNIYEVYKNMGLSAECSRRLIESSRTQIFEDIVSLCPNLEPAWIARVLTEVFTGLERTVEGFENITGRMLQSLFTHIDSRARMENISHYSITIAALSKTGTDITEAALESILDLVFSPPMDIDEARTLVGEILSGEPGHFKSEACRKKTLMGIFMRYARGRFAGADAMALFENLNKGLDNP